MRTKINRKDFFLKDITYSKEQDGKYKVAVLLYSQGNTEVFKSTVSNVKALNNAIRIKDENVRKEALLCLIKDDINHSVMDWIYNTSDTAGLFIKNKIPDPRDENKYCNQKETKPLFLILKKVYFDKIILGTKKIEYRDYKAFYISRLMREGKYRDFKVVRFKEGYNTNAREMSVEINQIVHKNGAFEIHLDKIISTNF